MVRILCPARATLARHNDIKPYSDGVVRLTTAAVRPKGRDKMRNQYKYDTCTRNAGRARGARHYIACLEMRCPHDERARGERPCARPRALARNGTISIA